MARKLATTVLLVLVPVLAVVTVLAAILTIWICRRRRLRQTKTFSQTMSEHASSPSGVAVHIETYRARAGSVPSRTSRSRSHSVGASILDLPTSPSVYSRSLTPDKASFSPTSGGAKFSPASIIAIDLRTVPPLPPAVLPPPKAKSKAKAKAASVPTKSKRVKRYPVDDMWNGNGAFPDLGGVVHELDISGLQSRRGSAANTGDASSATR